MRFDLRRPCPQCPFRTDLDFHLRPGRVEDILRGIIEDHASFPCHKTLDYGDEESLIQGQWHTEKTQQCAGAMIFLLKYASPNLPMRVASIVGWLDLDALDLDAPVFDTREGMIEHYHTLAGRPSTGMAREDRRDAPDGAVGGLT